MGKIRTVIPNTNAIFAILDPMIFPIAISGCPFAAALMETISSGADVQNEITVIPITRVEI